jgi:hypothetical protein
VCEKLQYRHGDSPCVYSIAGNARCLKLIVTKKSKGLKRNYVIHSSKLLKRYCINTSLLLAVTRSESYFKSFRDFIQHFVANYRVGP